MCQFRYSRFNIPARKRYIWHDDNYLRNFTNHYQIKNKSKLLSVSWLRFTFVILRNIIPNYYNILSGYRITEASFV